MGKETFSRVAYTGALRDYGAESGKNVTERAEQKARQTGMLDPLVDPSGGGLYGPIRRSLPRLEQVEGYFRLTVGCPLPIETRVDTTGSMGNNVDIAMRVLPNMYELCVGVASGYDLQIATGIFGDVLDDFVLGRPQFEMEAKKIVRQLSLLVPQRAGGDIPEDPHYGLFAGAYLTARYINKIGLRGYDFTVSDAPARARLDEQQLYRIFGHDVFERVAEIHPQLDRARMLRTATVVQDLSLGAHAFFLQVGKDDETHSFWTEMFGNERVVMLPSTELLPHVQAVIIGLSEGTLSLTEVKAFLTRHNLGARETERIVRSVAHIPLRAQAMLPNFSRRPKQGDLFSKKTDVWPMDHQNKPQQKSGTVRWLV